LIRLWQGMFFFFFFFNRLTVITLWYKYYSFFMKWSCIWNVTFLLLLFWNEEYVKWEQMLAWASEECVSAWKWLVLAWKRGPFCIEIGWNVAQREFLRVKTATRVFTGHSRTSESQISHNFCFLFQYIVHCYKKKKIVNFLYVKYPFPCTF